MLLNETSVSYLLKNYILIEGKRVLMHSRDITGIMDVCAFIVYTYYFQREFGCHWHVW